jgi:DNA-binding beta-propeller fold protein YncE
MLVEISFTGEFRDIVVFPLLDSGQQAVPAGLAVDPRTGDLLVALFSGYLFDEQAASIDDIISFVEGDAKIVRVDPDTGDTTDEIIDLTTAVDVAIDEAGNIYVVELTTTPTKLLPTLFDLYDPQAPPVHGGYLRFSGRVTLYPADGCPPRVLASGLDAPTNITIGHDGSLYISVGQGTPGRPIPGPDGITQIRGEILRITNFLSEDAVETEQ